MKQRMVQNAFGPVHKSLHTTCLKITHQVLILATGRSRGHTKDWTVALENGPSPSQPLRAQYARSARAVQELGHGLWWGGGDVLERLTTVGGTPLPFGVTQ